MLETQNLVLILPGREHESAAKEYIAEHKANGELHLHGASLLETMDYDSWLSIMERSKREETAPFDWVAATELFALRKSDGRLVGMINIRHSLNDFLRSYGGHIGYGVRPSERRKGYATQMLALGLAYAKEIGLKRVMVSCNKSNVASAKTIIGAGGVLEREFLHDDGEVVQIYWIALTKDKTEEGK